jgi:hypothetical protein
LFDAFNEGSIERSGEGNVLTESHTANYKGRKMRSVTVSHVICEGRTYLVPWVRAASLDQGGLDYRAVAIAEFDPLILPVEGSTSFCIEGFVGSKDGNLEVIILYEIAIWRSTNTISEQ